MVCVGAIRSYVDGERRRESWRKKDDLHGSCHDG